MSLESCRRKRGTGRLRVVGANLPVGGAAVLRRIARGELSDSDTVTVFLRDCSHRAKIDEACEGLTLLVPPGKRLADLEWPYVPAPRCRTLPNVALWGVGVAQAEAEAACRILVRLAYARVLLWLGGLDPTPRYTLFEAGKCDAD